MAERKRIKKNRGNLILALVSILLSVILWAVLSVTVFSDVQISLYDVPIDFNLEGSYANLASLSVISNDVSTVNLSFTGQRDSYKDYTNDDVKIRLNLDNVKASGAYDIPLIVESTRGDRISDVAIYPESVHIVFDRIVTKTLTVEDGSLTVDLSNVQSAQDYAIDPEEIAVTPSQVTVSGPQDYIDQVTSCVLSFDSSRTLNSSVNMRPDIVSLYNGDAVFEHPSVTLGTTDFSVYISVYITKTLSLNFGIMGYTDEVDTDSIPYTMSAESILVRSQSAAIENIDQINLGFIDVKNIQPGYVQSFTIPEQTSNYTNISGIDEVQVSFPLEGYSTKRITLSNSQIYTINGSSTYDVTVEQNRITVTVVGPEEILEQIDASDFVAQIDLIDYGPITGTRFLTAYVYAPNYPNIWATGTNQVLASFEIKTPEQQQQQNEQ